MSFLVDVAIFLVVLGWLVFFHELGHFLAAKACGIYCDRFSLGMPPRFIGIRLGETDYCLGALPLGGYVKMAGQEDAPQTGEEREKEYGHVPPERWYNNRPVWQRFFVIASGPLMNLVLALLLYAIVAAVGAEVPETKFDSRVGLIEPDSPASRAPMYRVVTGAESTNYSKEPDAVGWQTGDRVTAINGDRITSIADVAVDAILGGGQVLEFSIERTGPDGSVTPYLSPVAPERLGGESHVRVGIAPFSTALVGLVTEGMPAEQAGIRPGDIIARANGAIVDSQTLTDLIKSTSPGETLDLEVHRGAETLRITLDAREVGRFVDLAFIPPVQWDLQFTDDSPLTVAFPGPEFLAGAGLREGDVVKKLDGEPATASLFRRIRRTRPDDTVAVTVARGGSFLGFGGNAEEMTVQLSVMDLCQALTPFDLTAPPAVGYVSEEVSESTGLKAKDIILEADDQPATPLLLDELESARLGKEIAVKVRRPAIWGGLLRKEEMLEARIPVTPVGAMGVVWDTKTVFHRAALLDIVPEAGAQAWEALERTLRVIGLLFAGGLSPKDLGGPLMIGQVVTGAAHLGMSWLLEMTAFISINLCVFNLLPLPVLDGGHLAFLTLEGIRRKPLSVRVMESIQKFGLVFIILLVLFVTYNDIARWVSSIVP